MSPPESRGPGRTPLPAVRVNAFFHHLGRTGSVTVAANRAQLRRSALYERRQNDDDFAARWAQALDLGVERLQDNAMNRAMNGTPRPVWRNGQEVGSVRQFDNRLLQFLLKAHRPDLYGDRGKAAAPALPFDLVKRMADAEARLAEREKKAGAAKKTKGKKHAK
ncbi:hypothetical protein [Reyranella sp.]|uniref:hypothetical protein n=1 Tax=Reyranella sp. TaxID=1929291 RepID=UPI00273012EA|nr:hypothetical protein [Reyranella sp.]MDP2374617.1 hypothetical protein [Reyranella sp.]